MTDAELIALCAFSEAGIESDDGLAAVVQVIKNRIARKYQSDGTVPGTIFHGNGTAFSWAAFEMKDGEYQRVADGLPKILGRAERLLSSAKDYRTAWARASRIATAVESGTYTGADFAHVTPDTVLYLNPKLAKAAWATPAHLVCTIGHHAFYRG